MARIEVELWAAYGNIDYTTVPGASGRDAFPIETVNPLHGLYARDMQNIHVLVIGFERVTGEPSDAKCTTP